MRNLILKQIKLKDWRAQNICVDFSDKRTVIKARNGMGKTSVMNAWRWLLTGRTDPAHVANYELFDNRVALTPYTPVAYVEATINIDGYDYVISREAKASFSRPRGETEWIKNTSDKYRIMIEGVEYSSSQFASWITQNVCPVEMLPYIIDGCFFSYICEDDKRKARKILDNIVGDVSNSDVKEDYSLISDFLSKLSAEQIINKSREDQKRSEDDIIRLKHIIESNRAFIDCYKDKNFDEIKERIDVLKQELEDNRNNKSLSKRLTLLSERVAKQGEIIKAKEAYDRKYVSSIHSLEMALNEMRRQNEKIEKENEYRASEYKGAKAKIDSEKELLVALNDELSEVKKEKEKVQCMTYEKKCPTCGAYLDDNFDDSSIIEKFNDAKKKRVKLLQINKESLIKRINDCEERIKKYESIIEIGCKSDALSDSSDLERQLELTKKEYIPFEETAEFLLLNAEVDAISDKIDNLFDDNEKERELLSELESQSKLYGIKDEIEKAKTRIAESEKDIKNAYANVAKSEAYAMRAKALIEEKAQIVSDRINQKMTNGCSIRMWSKLKNGEKFPDCVLLDAQGVAYGTTNTASRIKINIALQEMFMKHYDIKMPIFIDEASVFDSTNIPNVNGQHVLIFADDSDFRVIC